MALPNGLELYQFSAYSSDDNVVTFSKSPATLISQNQPCVVYNTTDKDIVVSYSDEKADLCLDHTTDRTKESGKVSFNSSFGLKSTADSDVWTIDSDKKHFRRAEGQALPSYRCYFTGVDANTVLLFTDGTLGISDISVDTIDNEHYYTTDGLNDLNNDFNVLQWVSMAFVFVVLLLSFHFNIKHTILGFAPILLSWLIVLGAMAIFGIRFNLINIIISTFIFGIGVDYSIFIMNGLISDSQEKGTSVLAYHKTAIFFSAFILIVTVASMLVANHPAIKSVGFATLVGMISAVVLSYVVQPAIFRLWNNKH